MAPLCREAAADGGGPGQPGAHHILPGVEEPEYNFFYILLNLFFNRCVFKRQSSDVPAPVELLTVLLLAPHVRVPRQVRRILKEVMPT